MRRNCFPKLIPFGKNVLFKKIVLFNVVASSGENIWKINYFVYYVYKYYFLLWMGANTFILFHTKSDPVPLCVMHFIFMHYIKVNM